MREMTDTFWYLWKGLKAIQDKKGLSSVDC